MNKKLIKYLSVALLLIGFSALVYAKGGGDKKAPANVQGSPFWTHFNINNISTWFSGDGNSDISQAGNSGLVYPKGSGRTAAYESGLLWGGNVDGTWAVGGSTYFQGCLPGRILPDGTAEPQSNADVRTFRVRRDYKDPNADFSAEIDDGEGTAAEIYAQYDKDWQEWPADQGAPYEDVNGNGKYDPAVDIPGVPGSDQTIWFVCNDLDPTTVNGMYGALPMGIEEQVTIWGYKATGALGNMFFRKYTLINKNMNQKPFTDMYVSMWSDVDLGDAGDDYVGCDTTLSLMYFYNGKATDLVYSPLPPPSTGFDFFQGPALATGDPNDRAIFKGKYKYGYKNLPMTVFYFFINGDAVYSDPVQGNYTTGALEWKNLFEGKVSTTGQPFTDPHTGAVTKFALAGDPITQTGWVDGQLHAPGDRRAGMTSGPFNMAYGDTQEVVVSEMCAGATPGVDRLGAIQLLKFYDKQAQLAYDNFFNVPKAPSAPVVTATALDNEVVLSWGSDFTAVNKTESYSQNGFTFQGYVVYQIDPTGQVAPKRVATYDIVDGVGKILDDQFDTEGGVVTPKVVEFGSDSGIQRFISITTDAFNGGTVLRNGSRYIFAVTAYAFNPDPNAVPKTLESTIAGITIYPHAPDPGVRLNGSSGQVIATTHSSGVSDGVVTPTVVDPSKLTGHNYKVSFDTVNAVTVWKLTDVTTNTVKLSNQAQAQGLASPMVDGMLVQVDGPPPGMKEWSWIPSANRHWTWVNANWGAEGFSGAIGNAYDQWFASSTIGYDKLKNVELRFATTDADGNITDPNDANASYAYRYLRAAQLAPAKPEFAPYIKNTSGSFAFQDYTLSMPFAAYDVEANPARRLMVGYSENNQPNGLVDGKYWPPYYNDPDHGDNIGASGPREWFFIFDVTYSTTPDPALEVNILGNTLPIQWFGTITRRDQKAWSNTDKFEIVTNHINTLSDVMTFTAPSVVNDPNLAKTDVQDINVFPNPYYGVNSQELNKYQRFVTFSHLPAKATIRIFNLAGQQVRKLEKNTTDQFFRWDLANENQLPVASGLYIVYIDMPDLGTTKILKVAIIQEQQVLDRF